MLTWTFARKVLCKCMFSVMIIKNLLPTTTCWQTLGITEVYSVSVTSLNGFSSRIELSGKLNCFRLSPSTLTSRYTVMFLISNLGKGKLNHGVHTCVHFCVCLCLCMCISVLVLGPVRHLWRWKVATISSLIALPHFEASSLIEAGA